MDKTNYLLDKVFQLENELQQQSQINLDTKEKIDASNEEVTSLKNAVTENTSSRHTHSNQSLLDSYTQLEMDLADAVSKKHNHANIDTLNNTTASYTKEEKNKLTGIEAGAKKNIQSDWAQSDTTADDFIKNKPANAKLYDTTGQNTDGAMTQKATTETLNTKINADASNLTDANIASLQNKFLPALSVTAGTTRSSQKDTVVKYYVSSNKATWYRIWASGWKECGGYVSGANIVTDATITLPITFNDSNYKVQLTAIWAQSYGAYNYWVVGSQAQQINTQFVITGQKLHSNAPNIAPIYWEAKGY